MYSKLKPYSTLDTQTLKTKAAVLTSRKGKSTAVLIILLCCDKHWNDAPPFVTPEEGAVAWFSSKTDSRLIRGGGGILNSADLCLVTELIQPLIFSLKLFIKRRVG